MLLSHYKLNEHEEKLLNMSSKEFDDYMLSKYPNQFKNRYRKKNDEYILPMHFGFEIGNGWRHVLDSLCSKLQFIEEKNGVICVFDQIKEKFGGARFYYHTDIIETCNESANIAIKIIDNLVHSAEEYCDYICDELGTNVYPWEKIYIYGWYYGCGLEGFKKRMLSGEWGKSENIEQRIKAAEESYNRAKRLHEIKSKTYLLKNEDLNTIENLLDQRYKEMMEERENSVKSMVNKR